MDWTKFNTYGESDNHAFEVMCNMIFNKEIHSEYGENVNHFAYVNGSGGDGGVEAYCELKDGSVIAIQSKWFPNRLDRSQFAQLQNSLDTAIKVRPAIAKYIICVPRDFTSEKLVIGGKVTTNTEDDDWRKFKSNNKEKHPSVELILWDETTIYQKLTDGKNAGIFRHFFEGSIVSFDGIKLSFDKAKLGWANTKYIPDLYSQGYIHKHIQKFTGSTEINIKRYKCALNVKNSLCELANMYKDILRISFPEAELSHIDLIKSDLQMIDKWLILINRIIQLVRDGGTDNGFFSDNDFKFEYSGKKFKESSVYFHHYFHYSEFELAQDRFYNDIDKCAKAFGNYDDNKIIFLGNPGTGKTVGAVLEIQSMFDEKIHLPILVRARDFKIGDSWKKIILQTLGLADTWNETELFSALQASAQIYMESDFDILVQPKVVIVVDGIDESSDWDFWKEKIKETNVYKQEYGDLKFVFLSRPYVFENHIYRPDLSRIIRRIPHQGDVSVETIFDQYINYFNIDVGSNSWIKHSLKTPLSLKLFCDLYKGQRIGVLPRNSAIITNCQTAHCGRC